MSWNQVRPFFNTQIALADSDLVEWTESFDPETDNIPQTLIDNSYHLFFEAGNSNPSDGTSLQDNLAVTLTMWKRGFNNPASALDSLMDRAYCVRTELVDARNAEIADNNIEAVENTTIVPGQVDESNDNTLQVQLGFNVRLYYRNPNI